MKRLAEKTTTVAAMVPVELHRRLIRQAGKETAERGLIVTQSQIIRWAIERYLDMCETATVAPARSDHMHAVAATVIAAGKSAARLRRPVRRQ